MRQPQPICTLVLAHTTDPELAHAAEAHARDDGRGAEVRELICVPADTLAPAAVAVDECGVDVPRTGLQLAVAARTVCEVRVYTRFNERGCGLHARREKACFGPSGTLVGVLLGGGRGGAQEEGGPVRGDDGATEEHEFGGRGEGGALVEELGEEGGSERGGQERRVEGCRGEGCEVKRCVQVQGVSFLRRPRDRCRGGQERRQGGLLRGGGGPRGAGLEKGRGGRDGAIGGEEELQQRGGVCGGVQRGEEGELEVGGFFLLYEGRGGGGLRVLVRWVHGGRRAGGQAGGCGWRMAGGGLRQEPLTRLCSSKRSAKSRAALRGEPTPPPRNNAVGKFRDDILSPPRHSTLYSGASKSLFSPIATCTRIASSTVRLHVCASACSSRNITRHRSPLRVPG